MKPKMIQKACENVHKNAETLLYLTHIDWSPYDKSKCFIYIFYALLVADKGNSNKYVHVLMHMKTLLKNIHQSKAMKKVSPPSIYVS